MMALQRGIRIHQDLDDWLVQATSHQICLQHTQTLVALCQELGWLVNMEKSELDPKQVFDFLGYQFDLQEGKVRPTLDWWRNNKNQRLVDWTDLSGPATNVPHRSIDSHRKASPFGSTSHETHTVASQKQLEGSRITRKGDTSSQITPPPPEVVVGGKQCSTGSTIAPPKACSATVYTHIQRRLGHSLKRPHSKGNPVPTRKQTTYQLDWANSAPTYPQTGHHSRHRF